MRRRSSASRRRPQERIDRAQAIVDEKTAELEGAVADKRTEVDAAHESEKKRVTDQQSARTEELATAAQAVEASIKAGGKSLAEDVVFAATGEVIGRGGEASKDALAQLRSVVKAEVESVDSDAREALASSEEKYQAAIADLTSGIQDATAVGAPAGGVARPTTPSCGRGPRRPASPTSRSCRF